MEEIYAEERTRVDFVSGNFFDALGIHISQGRGFLPDEDLPGTTTPVVILSHAVWSSYFGADPQIVGRTLKVNGVPATVVGVVTREFQGIEPGEVQIYMPLHASQHVRAQDSPLVHSLNDPRACCVNLYARLRPGFTQESANQELGLLTASFREEYDLKPLPAGVTATAVMGTRMVDTPHFLSSAAPILILLILGLTLVLVLVCATVGNLLLAKAEARQQEIAVRLSLGASRARVIRQLLTESLLLAMMSGVGAMAVAYWLPQWALRHLTGGRAEGLFLRPDWPVAVGALVLASGCCLLFGLAPALHGTRISLSNAVGNGAAGASSRHTFRSVLLGIQVALSLVLLTGATLTLRGIHAASTRDLGFSLDGVTVLSVDLPAASLGEQPSRRFARDFEAALSGIPGENQRTQVKFSPISGSIGYASISSPEDATTKRGAPVLAITPSYFEVLGIPLLAGRNFTATDRDGHGVIINQTMARVFWPEGNPVGRLLSIGGHSKQVIGVVQDAELTSPGLRIPMLFEPSGNQGLSVLVRSTDEAMIPQIKSVVHSLEPGAYVRTMPLSRNLDHALEPLRAGASIASVLGSFSLILAAVGMAGVFGYVVQRRTKEIGIRMALGARALPIARLIVWRGGRPVFVGAMMGVLASMGLSQLLQGRLYGLSALDATSYLTALGVLLFASVLAGYIPLRRAMRIGPSEALRHE